MLNKVEPKKPKKQPENEICKESSEASQNKQVANEFLSLGRSLSSTR